MEGKSVFLGVSISTPNFAFQHLQTLLQRPFLFSISLSWPFRRTHHLYRFTGEGGRQNRRRKSPANTQKSRSKRAWARRRRVSMV